ncbi:hypothetical protein GCM10011529_02710 [Polymorphobacter glacialis]|uniref:Lactoylglutathione lyase n=1 Tax=Sandarakinorhabdus glacialis TaxID=1614636 RepID=A0A916ZJY2_9SPHN|nr:lactoylglutathione lyase [Polymorphobacter glacialis]GGD99992.1 hypothetical protein GCM10011529_02710 [Polymorphobacter glacialis]
MATANAPAPRQIFINLPVTDVARSTAFYAAVGTVRNPQFSNDSSSCMVISETIFVMLLDHARFRDFSPLEIPDAHRTTQVLLALSAENRAAVDAAIAAATAAGGRADPCPLQDHGFMYGRSYADPDGHIWETFWMDPAAAPQATQA